jgi:uncharacterized membrane protein YhaH (DUF805 family)
MKSAIIDGFKRWRDYSGRSTRAEFWWFQLLVVLWPIIASIAPLLVLLIGGSGVARLLNAILVPLIFLAIAPPFIAVSVRRMHDVGKSGWFNLVPIYSFYLHLQPAKELGRIPGWIFAERIALVFAGLTVIPVLTDGASGIGGLVFWSAVYAGIRFRNSKNKS